MNYILPTGLYSQARSRTCLPVGRGFSLRFLPCPTRTLEGATTKFYIFLFVVASTSLWLHTFDLFENNDGQSPCQA